MAAMQKLVFLSVPQLDTLLAAALDALAKGLGRGTSYSIAGKSFGFSSIAEITNLIQEIGYARSMKTGTNSETCRANFNPAVGRGA